MGESSRSILKRGNGNIWINWANRLEGHERFGDCEDRSQTVTNQKGDGSESRIGDE
jgi:hypothetical protein